MKNLLIIAGVLLLLMGGGYYAFRQYTKSFSPCLLYTSPSPRD